MESQDWSGPGERLELAARWPDVYEQPAKPPPSARLPQHMCRQPECDHMTLRCPDNHRHLLGHYRAIPGVTDVAAAMGRRAVRAGNSS